MATDDGRRGFVRWWLLSAALVTIIRVFNAGGPGFDLSIQLTAARNLLAGNGLTVFERAAADLTAAPTLVPLVHFPSGYSLATAALFAIGLDVGLAGKLLAGIATMLGWWGWAGLAWPFMRDGMRAGAIGRSIAVMLSMAVPLLFTLPWSGTDIFLWASIPWALTFVVAASSATEGPRRWLDVAAGAVCGFAFQMRYAALFLSVYAGLIILWQTRCAVGTTVRRGLLFAAGAVPAGAWQLYFNHAASNAAPGGLSGTAFTPWERLVRGLSLLHNSNESWAFWLPGKALTLLFPDGAGPLGHSAPTFSWQLGLTAGWLIVVGLAVRQYARAGDASRDTRVLALGMFVVIPAMLQTSMLFGSWDYVGDRRYYQPLIPLSVLVAYSAMFMAPRGRSLPAGLLRVSGALYTAGLVAAMVLYALVLPTSSSLGRAQRHKVFGEPPTKWPSFMVSYDLLPSRRFVIEQWAREPGALVLTSRGGNFFWDPDLDQAKMRVIGCGSRDPSQVTGPATIIIHTFDVGGDLDVGFYDGTAMTGSVHRISCYDGLPRQFLRRFPEEGMKVLVSRVPAGQVIPLGPLDSGD